MPVTNYYTVNGEIIGEQTTGQERIDYLTDPLGNVTATIDQNAKVLNRYTYKPFGEVLSKTGTAPDPKFLWVGSRGYRQTGNKHSDVYVRARHYDTRTGRWTSRDPLWPRESAYGYATSRPTFLTDPSGLQFQVILPVRVPELPRQRLCQGLFSGVCIPETKPRAQYPRTVCDITKGRDVLPLPAVPSPPFYTTQPQCSPHGAFPGKPLPLDWWMCMHEGIQKHCNRSSPFSDPTLGIIVRCIIFGETSDGKKDLPGEPFGLMQIYPNPWGKYCDSLGYRNWRTNPCDNIRCGIAILCWCLRHTGGDLRGCGFYGKPGEAQYGSIEHPGSSNWCDCMIGCGLGCGSDNNIIRLITIGG